MLVSCTLFLTTYKLMPIIKLKIFFVQLTDKQWESYESACHSLSAKAIGSHKSMTSTLYFIFTLERAETNRGRKTEAQEPHIGFLGRSDWCCDKASLKHKSANSHEKGSAAAE